MASSYSYLHLAFCTTSRMPSPGTLPKLKDHKLGGDSLHTGAVLTSVSRAWYWKT